VTDNDIIRHGLNVIRIETEAVKNLTEKIDDNFVRAVQTIYQCKGRVVLTGVGKSGLIARKIVATMNSTGTPAFYLHPTDALHGDLGMVRAEDAVIILSKSGSSDELLPLIQVLKRMHVPLIGILGSLKNKLAEELDIILNVEVAEEACPYDLAPTASTTAALVMGDALSVALLHLRGFTPDDFALLHPAGSLGKRLSLHLDEIMKKGDSIPIVKKSATLKDAIFEISSKRLGVTCCVDDDGKLAGILTDGDLRRLLEKTINVAELTTGDVMVPNPKVMYPWQLASLALQKMETHKITSIIVVDDTNHPVGVVHLHDLINLGLSAR